MAKKVSFFSANNQSFDPFNGLDNVFCSDLISYQKKSPSFRKIVRDYELGRAKAVEVSFKNRDYHFAIYKYTKFEYLRKSIKRTENGYKISLTFVSPYLWNDPCESVLYEPLVTINGESYNILCLCTTLEPTESEESAWNRSGRSDVLDEKTVRVAYDFLPFCNLLEKMAHKEEDVTFYLSMADYSESRSYFSSGVKKTYSSIEEYICELSKKRKAFAYENEMRVFMVRKITNENRIEEKDLHLMTFSAELDEEEAINLFKPVTLPPYPPFPKNNPKSYFYKNIQDLDNFDLRIALTDLFPFKINQSHLYEINGNSSFAKALVKKYKTSNPKGMISSSLIP